MLGCRVCSLDRIQGLGLELPELELPELGLELADLLQEPEPGSSSLAQLEQAGPLPQNHHIETTPQGYGSQRTQRLA